MDIHLLGAAGCVTGSRCVVTSEEATLLVDCGLFQGLKSLRARNWRPLPLDVSLIDAVLLTHAHIDHSGYIPRLVAEGFTGPVWCTEGTADLCALLLPDSGYLQEEDARFANKRGYSKHRPAEPLYTEAQARASLDALRPVAWDKPVQIKDVEATFLSSGHLLGASMVELQGTAGRVLFSGDLGRMNDALMRAPVLPKRAPDLLVLESTYGDRTHSDEDPLTALEAIVQRTIARGGTVLIPTFAVGRAQSVLLALHRLIAQGRLPSDLPIYLNSPMAVDATGLYQRHADLHRLSHEEIRAVSSTARHVRTVDESRRLNMDDGPKVILSASGMLTGGRVLHHLVAFAPDPKNTLLNVGFQASGTRGASIMQGAKSVRVHGEEVPIACEIARIDAWSAHADADEMLSWLKRFPAPPRHILLNHGEPEASEALRRRISVELQIPCTVAEMGTSMSVKDLIPHSPKLTVRQAPKGAPTTPAEAALRSMGSDRVVIVLGGAGIPNESEARRELTRASLATAERPEDDSARHRLRAAERRVDHARWIEQASSLPKLASDIAGLSLLCATDHALTVALLESARATGVQAFEHEALPIPDATIGIICFPGGLHTLASVFRVLDHLAAQESQLPILLVGRSYWHEHLDLDRLHRDGLMPNGGSLRVLYADDVAQAWGLLRGITQFSR